MYRRESSSHCRRDETGQCKLYMTSQWSMLRRTWRTTVRYWPRKRWRLLDYGRYCCPDSLPWLCSWTSLWRTQDFRMTLPPPQKIFCIFLLKIPYFNAFWHVYFLHHTVMAEKLLDYDFDNCSKIIPVGLTVIKNKCKKLVAVWRMLTCYIVA